MSRPVGLSLYNIIVVVILLLLLLLLLLCSDFECFLLASVTKQQSKKSLSSSRLAVSGYCAFCLFYTLCIMVVELYRLSVKMLCIVIFGLLSVFRVILCLLMAVN